MTGSELIASSNLEFDINTPYSLDLLVELNELSERVEKNSKPVLSLYRAFASFSLAVIGGLVLKLSGIELEEGSFAATLVYASIMMMFYVLFLDKLVDIISTSVLKKGSGGRLTNVRDFSFAPTKESILFFQNARKHEDNTAVQAYIKEIKGRGLVNIELTHLTEALGAEK